MTQWGKLLYIYDPGKSIWKIGIEADTVGKLLYIYGPGKSIRKIGIKDDTVR
jgi:hypothetical protein